MGQPINHAADPRWVLAVRVAEQLEGALLSPEKRHRLIRTAVVIGLTAFDANLIIAIVQDQARRGHTGPAAPQAAQEQLAMISLPQQRRRAAHKRRLHISITVAIILTLELAIILWLT